MYVPKESSRDLLKIGMCTTAALTEMRCLPEAPLPCPGPDRNRHVSLQAILTMSIKLTRNSLRVCAGGHQMVLLQPVKLHMCRDALYAPVRVQTLGAASLVLSGHQQTNVSTLTVSAATERPLTQKIL